MEHLAAEGFLEQKNLYLKIEKSRKSLTVDREPKKLIDVKIGSEQPREYLVG